MKAWVISDLHLEFGSDFEHVPPIAADVLICAGDVLTKGIVPSIEWLGSRFGGLLPIVFVAGNHEFWGAEMQSSIVDAKAAAQRYPDFHFLENEATEINGIRIIGATLWTDFRVLGRDPEMEMWIARQTMRDFKEIKWSKKPYRKFGPIHALRKHVETRTYLEGQLQEDALTTVVVTHHSPCIRSVPPADRDDTSLASYASDLKALIERCRPKLWIHGHVHQHNDYTIDETRIVSNARGYPGENTGFNPTFVVDLNTATLDLHDLAVSLVEEDEQTPSFGSALDDVEFRPLERRIVGRRGVDHKPLKPARKPPADKF
jgi:Icc-related predicted phosphoesterase